MMTQENLNKIVIIGGVAGGASAAARARRLSENAEITIIERGPDVSFANCGLPYFIGGEIKDRSRLAVQTPGSLQAMLRLKVKTNTEALGIDRDNQSVHIRDIETGEKSRLSYDRLILSPGASPLRPAMPGIDDPRVQTLRNLQDMDRMKDALETAQRICIVGAGFIGLEMAEQLHGQNKTVSLVELQPQVLPQMDPEMTKPVLQALKDNDVHCFMGDGISGFKDETTHLQVQLQSGATIDADLVILSIGVKPETQLAADAGLELGPRGHIRVNPFQQTNDPFIYAVGDAVETQNAILGGYTSIPLGGPANRQGRVAADHIFNPEKARAYPGSLGTAIVRVFSLTAGVTGHTEKYLKEQNIPYKSAIVTDWHHAGYYPGATLLTLKILWHAETQCLLGAQLFGVNGVDKRLDVMATAIRGKITIKDLCHLELAYAPPFGSAKDVVNLAGFAATNQEDELVIPAWPDALSAEVQLIDVRPLAMASGRPVANAINIPFGELRDRLNEIDRNRPVITVCLMGKMSYFACRVLRQNGIQARSLSGGLTVHSHLYEERIDPTDPPSSDKSSTNKGTEDALTMKNSITPETTLPPLQLDVTGMACPGPIMRIKSAVKDLEPGQVMEILSSDSGFGHDLKALCAAMGFLFHDVLPKDNNWLGRIQKPLHEVEQNAKSVPAENPHNTSMVVFSQDMDRALGALIIANGATAMGGTATLFFTFWGLNVLRREESITIADKSFMDKMFGWMMPRGLSKLPLSRMHFGGLGTAMMKWRMKSKDLPNLPGLLKEAKCNGVRLVACTMSMNAMGIREEELIDGVEFCGVAEYLSAASECRVNLFI